MMSRHEARQILFRELEQTRRGRQTPAVLGMRWVFESLLKMNKSAGGLDQSLKKIRIARFRFEPKLLKDVVRFVITLFVPATEKRAVKRVLCDIRLTRIDIVITQLSHQLRNPLAFAHGKLNLLAAQIMSKPPTISSSEDTLTCLLSLARERRPLRRATPCQRR